MATVVFCFLMSFLVIVGYKITNKTLSHPNIQMLITKRNLIFSAVKEYLFNFVAYTCVVVGVCSVMFVMGRINITTAIIAALVLTIIFGAVHIPVIETCVTLLKNMNGMDDYREKLEGKCINLFNEDWVYVDENCYISVGTKSACILCLSQIDFSRRIRFETVGWYLIHGTAYIFCIECDICMH